MLDNHTDSNLISFVYNESFDKKNLLLALDGEPQSRRKIGSLSNRLLRMIDQSYSPLLYQPMSREITIFPINVFYLKRAIIVPDSYELFWAPWLADGSFSYPTASCQKEWKRRYQMAHNAVHNGNELKNLISAERFAGIRHVTCSKPKVCLKSHIDSDNYWHWTFEWAPRLLRIKEFLVGQSIDVRDVFFFYVGSRLNRFQQEWIERIFPGVHVAHFPDGISCNRLVWGNISFTTHHCSRQIKELSDCIVDEDSQAICRTKRNSVVFIERGNSKNGRNISNASDLQRLLKKHGICSVRMDGLSVYEQAQIFRNSDMIIGPHGSAFVNMIYCTPGTKVLEIFGPGYLPGHDLVLADSCGLQWECVIGCSTDGVAEFHSDFKVDTLELEKRIMKMC